MIRDGLEIAKQIPFYGMAGRDLLWFHFPDPRLRYLTAVRSFRISTYIDMN